MIRIRIPMTELVIIIEIIIEVRISIKSTLIG
jgi:hypothetical protein